MFVYKIDVIKALSDRGYSSYRLRQEKLLGENALQSWREGKIVGIKSLEQICDLLNAQPGDIIMRI